MSMDFDSCLGRRMCLVPAAVLMLVTLMDAPDLLRWWKRAQARREPWEAPRETPSAGLSDG